MDKKMIAIIIALAVSAVFLGVLLAALVSGPRANGPAGDTQKTDNMAGSSQTAGQSDGNAQGSATSAATTPNSTTPGTTTPATTPNPTGTTEANKETKPAGGEGNVELPEKGKEEDGDEGTSTQKPSGSTTPSKPSGSTTPSKPQESKPATGDDDIVDSGDSDLDAVIPAP